MSTVTCTFCHCQLDPTSPTTVYRLVTGWEKKSTAGSRRGGSDIVLREPGHEFACAGCITLRKDGISPNQEALL